VKTERCEVSTPNRESGAGNFPSGEENIVAHTKSGTRSVPFPHPSHLENGDCPHLEPKERLRVRLGQLAAVAKSGSASVIANVANTDFLYMSVLYRIFERRSVSPAVNLMRAGA
jgi:hypothetical protein